MDKKVALVTGAGSGIGRAVAIALAAAGCHVLVNYRQNQTGAEATLNQIVQASGTGALCPFDVTNAAACQAALPSTLRVDILINNAGLRQDSLLVFMQPAQWSQVIATTLDGFFNVSQPLVKQMAMRRWGRIVTLASTAGQTGVEGQCNYAAAKAGVIGASKSLAREVAKRNVTVNVIAPGFIDTEMLEGLPAAKLIEQIPAGRLGRPEEVAAAAVFLCSENAAYITGAVLNINGGIYT